MDFCRCGSSKISTHSTSSSPKSKRCGKSSGRERKSLLMRENNDDSPIEEETSQKKSNEGKLVGIETSQCLEKMNNLVISNEFILDTN